MKKPRPSSFCHLVEDHGHGLELVVLGLRAEAQHGEGEVVRRVRVALNPGIVILLSQAIKLL